MLCDKHWVAAIWRLFSIIARGCGRESLRHELLRVVNDDCASFVYEILTLFCAECEPAPETRFVECCEYIVEIAHENVG